MLHCGTGRYQGIQTAFEQIDVRRHLRGEAGLFLVGGEHQMCHVVQGITQSDAGIGIRHVGKHVLGAVTLHKSSLSPSIHAIMGIEVGDFTRAEQYFARSAFVDLTDNQGNTAEGMHIASAGGTWQIVVSGFGGFRVRHGLMTFDPWLPPDWERLEFRLHWHGSAVRVTVTQDALVLLLDAPVGTEQTVVVQGQNVTLSSSELAMVPLHPKDRVSSATVVG